MNEMRLRKLICSIVKLYRISSLVLGMGRPCRSELGAGKTRGAQSLFVLVLVVRVGLDGAPVETRSLEWTEGDAFVSLTTWWNADQMQGRHTCHKGSF